MKPKFAVWNRCKATVSQVENGEWKTWQCRLKEGHEGRHKAFVPCYWRRRK